MSDTIIILIKICGYLFVAHIAMGAIHSTLFVSKGLGAVREYAALQRIRRKVRRPYFIPISVVVYCHQWDDRIVGCVENLLGLDYPKFEIIIVDDGENQNSVDQLVKEFELEKVDRPMKKAVFASKSVATYESVKRGVVITLIKKEPGTRGDAMNMGINASQFPFFLSMDGNMVLPATSLQLITQPILGNEKVQACLGQVLLTNSSSVDLNEFELPDMEPEGFLSQLETISYERGEIYPNVPSKIALARLVTQGNFTLFRKRTVVEIGGYDGKLYGYDRELIGKIAYNCHKKKADKEFMVATEDDAVGYTQSVSNLRELRHRSVFRHKSICNAMKMYKGQYMSDGILKKMEYVYYKLFMSWTPIIETIAVVLILAGLFTNQYSVGEALIMYFLFNSLYIYFTLASYIQKRGALGIGLSNDGIIKTIVACTIDNYVLRYFYNLFRIVHMFGKK